MLYITLHVTTGSIFLYATAWNSWSKQQKIDYSGSGGDQSVALSVDGTLAVGAPEYSKLI